MKIRKGVCYFQRFSDARTVRESIPGSRVVRYGLGFAIQWNPGGRYVGLTDLVAFCPESLGITA
jgi:hypothetical protein